MILTALAGICHGRAFSALITVIFIISHTNIKYRKIIFSSLTAQLLYTLRTQARRYRPLSVKVFSQLIQGTLRLVESLV